MSMLKKLATTELLCAVTVCGIRLSFPNSVATFGVMDSFFIPFTTLITGIIGVYRGEKIVESNVEYLFYLIPLILSILGTQNGIVTAAILIAKSDREFLAILMTIVVALMFVLLIWNAILIHRMRSAYREACLAATESESDEVSIQQHQENPQREYMELQPQQREGTQPTQQHPPQYIASHPLQVNVEMQQARGVQPLQGNVEILIEDARGRTMVLSPRDLCSSGVVYHPNLGFVSVQSGSTRRSSSSRTDVIRSLSFHNVQDYIASQNHPAPSGAPPGGEESDPPTYEEALHLKPPSGYE